jgi:hypothetical protein
VTDTPAGRRTTGRESVSVPAPNSPPETARALVGGSPERVCAVCRTPLRGRQLRTCSGACRAAWSRRQRQPTEGGPAIPDPTAADQPEASADPNAERGRILRELAAGLRDPFLRELARFLTTAPTEEQLRAFAAKSPDRWAQAIAIHGRLAGFDKLEVTGTLRQDVSNMSDSELLGELSERLQLPADELRKRLSPRALPPAGPPGR